MTREILFRGKRVDNGEWVKGYLICPEFDKSRAYIGYLFPDDDHDLDVAEVASSTVGRFTGLTDRNDVKIFDGDIIEFNQPYDGKSIHVVVQDGCGWNLSNFYASCFNCPGCAFSEGTKYMTVVGNIYDNPELLEVNSDE